VVPATGRQAHGENAREGALVRIERVEGLALENDVELLTDSLRSAQ
jgi:hypothetical protein